jgi:hypothetical protein
MDALKKRISLFLVACIGSRALFAYVSKTVDINYLPYLGYLALIPAIGFTYIFVTGSRTTGVEVFGDKIWWNNLRPVHAALYALFAYSAINKRTYSWMFLLIDVIIGLISFLYFHYMNGDFKKLLQ